MPEPRVFVDGQAETCPECDGSLVYQNQLAVVCDDCGAQFEHYYYKHGAGRVDQLVTAEHGGVIEVAAEAERGGVRA